jgi:hypothetical protein
VLLVSQLPAVCGISVLPVPVSPGDFMALTEGSQPYVNNVRISRRFEAEKQKRKFLFS